MEYFFRILLRIYYCRECEKLEKLAECGHKNVDDTPLTNSVAGLTASLMLTEHTWNKYELEVTVTELLFFL